MTYLSEAPASSLGDCTLWSRSTVDGGRMAASGASPTMESVYTSSKVRSSTRTSLLGLNVRYTVAKNGCFEAAADGERSPLETRTSN